MALEYLFCFAGRGTIPGHLKILGMTSDAYGQIFIFAYIVFLGFGHAKLKTNRQDIPFGLILFGLHCLCMAAVFYLTWSMWQGKDIFPFDPYRYIKSCIYFSGTILLVLACIPVRNWILAIRATGRLWLYALLTGVAGWCLGTPVRLLWRATSTVQSGIAQRFTLDAVSMVVGRFLPDMIVDPVIFAIGSPRYVVEIAPGCSGVEGLGLVLLFTSLWIWFFRKEIRFPRCLLLIPCAMGGSWLLNIARLSVLILLASNGFPEIATVGFHAAAGWIAFTIVALAFSLAVQKITWFQKLSLPATCTAASAGNGQRKLGVCMMAEIAERRGEAPEIRAYLLPFLAILAAAFISKAVSGYFEWFYPLRFIAASIALYFSWPELKKLNWHCGWAGPFMGAAAFLLWMTPAWLMHQHTVGRLGTDLAALSPASRWTWIAFRVVAAVITVPLAEELAFRGYLARRFIQRNFTSVPFTKLTALSIGLSSIVFGVMHGQQWITGIMAGLMFGLVLRWRGRMGDAVMAHAVCNLLLAGWVLISGDWAQW